MGNGFQYTSYMQLMTCCINDYHDGALNIYRILTVLGALELSVYTETRRYLQYGPCQHRWHCLYTISIHKDI